MVPGIFQGTQSLLVAFCGKTFVVLTLLDSAHSDFPASSLQSNVHKVCLSKVLLTQWASPYHCAPLPECGVPPYLTHRSRIASYIGRHNCPSHGRYKVLTMKCKGKVTNTKFVFFASMGSNNLQAYRCRLHRKHWYDTSCWT